MGKGDKKTRRGKIQIGSYGVKRPGKTVKTFVKTEKIEVPKPEKKKKTSTKEEIEELSKVNVNESADELAAETPKKVAKKPTKKSKESAE